MKKIGCVAMVYTQVHSTNMIKTVKTLNFSNSLIIHEEKAEEITTVKEVWICDPNYHKNR